VEGSEDWSVRGNRGDANLFRDTVFSDTPDVNSGAADLTGSNELGAGDPGPRHHEVAGEGGGVAAVAFSAEDLVAFAEVEALEAEDSEFLVLSIEDTVIRDEGFESLVDSPLATSLQSLVLTIAVEGHLKSRGSTEAFRDSGLLTLGKGNGNDNSNDNSAHGLRCFGMERNGCNTTALTGNLMMPWAWVSNSKFITARQIRGATIDIWGVTDNGVAEEIGVSSVAPDRPVFAAFHNLTSGTRREYIFETFVPFPPPARIFDVPRQCGNAF